MVERKVYIDNIPLEAIGYVLARLQGDPEGKAQIRSQNIMARHPDTPLFHVIAYLDDDSDRRRYGYNPGEAWLDRRSSGCVILNWYEL